MRIGYFDCFSGASGDMILGAIVDAGLPADALREESARLGVGGFEIDVTKVRKQGFAATQVCVRMTQPAGHRHLTHIVRILDGSTLEPIVRDRAKRVFTRLAEVEAAAHGTTIEKVHFHEVGAIDAMVDVVGAVAGLHRLGVERVECSPIPTGHGTVQCEHGVMPVPAPATAALLTGVPLLATDEPGELTTPTGAAILTTLAEAYGPVPSMTLRATGYGAGRREGETRPNLLRLLIGERTGERDEVDEIVVLEANLDDMPGEAIGFVMERLFGAGAVDVFTTPIQMKKNRPGVLLTALAGAEQAAAVEEVIFRETTTFGIRRTSCVRHKLERTIEPIATCYGRIRMKVGRRGGRIVMVSPEYEDCAAAARAHDVTLLDVMNEARHVWRCGVSGDEP